MPKLFLGVLAVAWIVVLVPPVLRARSHSRSRGDSIGDFQNRLGVLSRTHSSLHFRRAARAARADVSPMPGVASALGARRPSNRLRSNRRISNGLTAHGPAAKSRAVNRSVPSPMTAPLPGPMTPARTPGAERSARRRREVVTVLFAATTLSAAIASAMGGAAWGLQIFTDLLMVVYVAGMLWFRAGSLGARAVRYLPQVAPRPAAVYALRRTASS